MLKPKYARLLIQREKLSSKTSIIIPESVEKRNAPTHGVIIAIGDGCDDEWHIGQKVVFGVHAGGWFKYDNEEYFICADEDILAVVEEKE